MLAAVLVGIAVGGLGNIREEPSSLLEKAETSSGRDAVDDMSEKWSALQKQDTSETQKLEARLQDLSKTYLQTVEMGLLGGLTHDAYLDVTRGGTTDYEVRNECLTRDWQSGGVQDNCIIKWDGFERLERIKDLFGRVQKDSVPGDLVECGVWRGGITVMMRALLKAYGDEDRKVWAVDSFDGVPNSERQKQRKDMSREAGWVKWEDQKQWGGHVWERSLSANEDEGHVMKEKNLLTVEESAVQNNFKRFGLLDDRVKFVKGFFNDTLPTIGSKYGLSKISILRVDGDLYESTMDVLKNLYPLVSPGGWIVLDDWPLPQSKQATKDFLRSQGLSADILRTDRVTPERRPKFTHSGAPLGDHSDINKNAYFQKPRVA